MLVETGLQDGMRAMWKEDVFLDYTLKAEDQEFRVHKLVLASVSDYFRTMLNGSMMESESTMVHLKQFSADRISNLVEFIYTGRYSLIKKNPKEMLECGVYFQMPILIKECTKRLLSKLSVENCLNMLCTFTTFSLDDVAKEVATFVKKNIKKVMVHYKPADMTAEGIQVIMQHWDKSEWEMVKYVISWVSANYEERKQHVNFLMSDIRFCLLSQEELTAVLESKIYNQSNSDWKDLVDKAVVYHGLPIHLKVADDSVQSMVRGDKSLAVMSIDKRSTLFTLTEFGNMHSWVRRKSLKSPEVTGMPFVTEVNNYLVACSEFGEHQQWQVFDPRTLTWTKMADMPKPKDRFALVHHDKHLYVLGGCGGSSVNEASNLSDDWDQYNFETGAWSSTKKLPVAVKDHAACVFKDAIYISGGRSVDKQYGLCASDRLHRLDIKTNTWERKAPMLEAATDHKISVMKLEGVEGLLIIDDIQDMRIGFYNPQTNQWSWLDFCRETHPIDDELFGDCAPNYIWWGPESRMYVAGKAVFLLNFETSMDEWYSLSDDECGAKAGVCLKWVVKQWDQKIKQFAMEDFPVEKKSSGPTKAVIGMLAFPTFKK